MLKEDYIKQMSSLTNLPASFLNQLYKLNMLAVSNELHTQMVSKEPIKKVSLSTYGELRIHQENGNLIYKFLPSDEFNSIIRKTIIERKDQLEEKLEERLVKKIYDNYSDFMEGSLDNIEIGIKVYKAFEDIYSYINSTSNLDKIDTLNYIKSVLLKAGMKEVIDGRKQRK